MDATWYVNRFNEFVIRADDATWTAAGLSEYANGRPVRLLDEGPEVIRRLADAGAVITRLPDRI